MTMNILLVNPNVTVGGAQKILLYTAKGLEARGHRVWIYTTHVDFANLPPFARRLSYVVEDVPILRRGGELSNYTPIGNVAVLGWRLLALRRGLRRAIREHRIDVVSPMNPPANWLCSFLPVPVVWYCLNHPMAFYHPVRAGYISLRSSKRGWHHRLLEGLYELADYIVVRYGIPRIISVSEPIARAVSKVYGRTSEVIPFGLAVDDGTVQGRPAATVKFGALNHTPLVLLQVGQLNEHKRPRFSLDVLDAVQHRIRDVRLLYVGDGPLRPSLEAEARRRGLADRVEFLGWKDETALAGIYASAHLLLFPGVDQPLGLVPIEAIWNAVVPVVADSSGIKDFLERCGLMTFAEPTVEAFAARVSQVYDCRDEMDARILQARERLTRELNYDVFLDAYERSLLAQRRRPCVLPAPASSR